MSRKILILLAAMFLLVAPVLGQEVYSETLTESQQRIDVNGEVIKDFSAGFTGQNLSIEISRVNETVEDLKVYRAYSLKTSGNGEMYSLNLTVDVEDWMNSTDLDDYETALIRGEALYIASIQDKGEYFYANLPRLSPPTTIYIAGTDNLYEKAQLAVNSDRTLCGLYLDLGQEFEKVETCRNKLGADSSTSGSIFSGLELPSIDGDILKTAAISIGLLTALIAAIIFARKHVRDDAEDIAELTEKLINKMKTGEIEKDEEILQKLEKSNELAYNGEYAEANRILDQVKKDLKKK